MKLDVVVYLLRGGVAAFGSAREHLVQKLHYAELPMRDNVGFNGEMVLLTKQHDDKRPEWVGWCAPLFHVDDAPVSAASGTVLLLVAAGRTFAVAFGTGWNALPRNLVEPDFGLRVAMQLVPAAKVRSVVTKSVDLATNEKNVYNHTGSDLAQFPLDVEAEWLRQTGGVVDGTQGFAAVSGKTGLRLMSYGRAVEALPATCAWLLGQFNQPVPEAFRFYENLQPIDRHDPQHQALEDQLAAKLEAAQFDGLTVVIDRETAERAHTRALKHSHRSVALDDVTDELVWAAVHDHAAHASDYEVKKLTLYLKDETGKKLVREPLLRFIHAELTDATGVWMRMEGSWFRATRDYVESVDQMLRAEVNEITTSLQIPDWDKGTHGTELSFNTVAAAQRQWLLQDQKDIHLQGKSIEPCDLLTEDAHFIHLKNAESSQHVGALVGQLRGAAYMLKNDEPFRQEMAQRYHAWSGQNDLLDKRATFVLALARQPHLDIFGNMLVAKINILDCGRRVRSMGHDFAVCKVNRT